MVKKGCKHSQETKDKISAKVKGIKLTQKHKANITKGLLARKYKHNKETKEKIRQSNLGKKRSKETCENIRKSQLGVKRSNEAKLAISKGMLGRVVSEETRKKISIANKGKYFLTKEQTKINAEKRRGYKHTKEAIEKIKEAGRNRIRTKETIEKIRKANKGQKRSKEFKALMSKMSKGRKVTIESRKKQSNSLLKFYKNNESVLKNKKLSSIQKMHHRIAAIKRVERQKFNGLPLTPCVGKYEHEVLNILENNFGYKIERQYRVNGYFLDGYCSMLNLAIEIDESFHKKQMKKDKNREKQIIKELHCQFLRVSVGGL